MGEWKPIEPRLIRRARDLGWLALSPVGFSLQIGVTAPLRRGGKAEVQQHFPSMARNPLRHRAPSRPSRRRRDVTKQEDGRVPSEPGSREPSPSTRSRPNGFDPSREKVQHVNGLALVLPLCEPFASFVWRAFGLALAGWMRWDSWGVGFEFLRGGIAVQCGPGMLALVRVTTFLRDSDGSPEGRDAEERLDGNAATARAVRHRPEHSGSPTK